MSKYVVTHHAHHAKEKVYKLAYAIQTDDGNLVPQPDIVWDVRDPKWKDRSPEDIADEQRFIVKEMLDKRASDQEKAEIETKKAITHFKDSIGQQL